ncbi:MAG: DUF1015 domain-containing protein [Anaerolineae bacterium]
MVETLPLRGLRYAPTHNQPTVFAPPYDVISPVARAELVARDQYNIAHIDVTPAGAALDWYIQAREILDSWRQTEVLIGEDAPAYYGYVQRFRLADGSVHVRRGLYGAVRLAEWEQGIFRHEHTRAAPRADRLNLMRATQAQLSPVFGMVSDPEGQLMRWLQVPQMPVVDYVDQEGTQQVFWPITDAANIAEIRAFLAPRDIVIADGHHRYETALAYRNERHTAVGNTEQPQSYDYVLMYLTAVEDPGLVILPTHRVIAAKPSIDAQTLLAQLAANFQITPVTKGESLETAIDHASDLATAFGLYLGNDSRWTLRLRGPANAQRPTNPAVPDDLAHLDVSVLQNLILEPCFHIDSAALTQGEYVRYTISESEACSWVDEGQAQAAFILNPTSLQQVWQTARHLVTMPQKSTYFYPKLLTGLVIHILD